MRVLFRALLLAGAVAVVWFLRPRGGAAPKTSATAEAPHAEIVPRVIAPPRFESQVSIAPAASDDYRGVVLDGMTGEPVEAAQVMLCRGLKDGHPACADSIASADTDEHGRFQIERPDEPVGALVVDDDDYAVSIVNSPAAISRIELWPAGVVRGHVVDGSGKPLDGMRVGWMVPGAQLRLDSGGPTERGGQFEIDRLPAGDVVVYALADDNRQTIQRLSLARAEHRDLELVLEETETLHVRGMVHDRNLRPLAFVQVTIEQRSDLAAPDPDALLAASQRNISTDIDGEFVVDFYTPGPHRLSFWAWSRETGDLLAEAQVTAADDPPVIKIPVWDPNIMVCTLEGSDGQAQPFTEYSFHYSMVDDDESGAAIGMLGGGNKGHDQMAFVWPRRVNSIEITLTGESAEGSVELRGPNDRCLARGDR